MASKDPSLSLRMTKGVVAILSVVGVPTDNRLGATLVVGGDAQPPAAGGRRGIVFKQCVHESVNVNTCVLIYSKVSIVIMTIQSIISRD